MTKTKSIKAFAFLKKIHDEFQDLALMTKFDKQHKLHRIIMGFYGSILELTSGCILLVDKGLIIGLPIMQRSILEAYVDLVNLLETPTYGYSLELDSIKEMLKVLKSAKNGNRHLSELTGLTEKYIDEYTKKIKELSDSGYKIYSHKGKFIKANMQDEYESIYNKLCFDSHNNLSALFERHFEQTGDDVIFFKNRTIQDCEKYILMNIDILIKATIKIHYFFDSPVKSQATNYWEEFESMHNINAR